MGFLGGFPGQFMLLFDRKWKPGCREVGYGCLGEDNKYEWLILIIWSLSSKNGGVMCGTHIKVWESFVVNMFCIKVW